MMKILLLSRYPRMGASTRLRALQYLPYFAANGLEVTVKSLVDDRYLKGLYGQGDRSSVSVMALYLRRLFWLFFIFRYDIIWIEKELFPYMPAVVERLLKWLGKPYVVDYDDAVFHNYDLSENQVVRTLLRRKIDVVMRLSCCVVAGNAYLAERARIAGASWIVQVPTVVDGTRYLPRQHSAFARPVIGWIGSPSTQKYVVNIHEALTAVCQAFDARLVLVGATPQVADFFPGMDVQVIPWTEDSEAELIRQMDVGIMPLPDGPWEKGKCGYKLIQYMAGGVPVIASPVGVNVDIVGSCHCGLLADTPAEWEQALRTLLFSPEKRCELGMAGRLAVENHYSLQVQAPVLVGIFNDIIAKRRV